LPHAGGHGNLRSIDWRLHGTGRTAAIRINHSMDKGYADVDKGMDGTPNSIV